MNSFPAQYSESMTAAAMSVRLSVGRTRESDPYLAMGETLLAARVPVWDVARGTTDLYYWVHGAEALHWLGGAAWDAWRKALVGALVPSQRPATDGCSRGSWDPHDPWCQEGGRIWMTTAAMLCLEHAAADPARRPALPQTVRPCTWALEKLLKAQDPVVRAAARRALDAIRGAYK